MSKFPFTVAVGNKTVLRGGHKLHIHERQLEKVKEMQAIRSSLTHSFELTHEDKTTGFSCFKGAQHYQP